MSLLRKTILIAAALISSAALAGGVRAVIDDPYAAPRRAMVREIEADVRETSSAIGGKSLGRKVMDVMGRLARHEFVPKELRDYAYLNRPLPIGHGQTISQPYIVALMTDLLKVGPGAAVLEVGTGSGYQAAVLAELGCRVYTTEIIPELAASADERLRRLGYREVKVRAADGYYGWEEHAPFDAVIVTAAASHIPPPLIKQLKPGGVMIIPVGMPFMVQYLVLVEKGAGGKISSRQVLPVSFVPLTGAGAKAR